MSDKDNRRRYYDALRNALIIKMRVEVEQYKQRIIDLQRYLEVLEDDNYKLQDKFPDDTINDLENALKL
jgi:hypothetical protein